MVPYLIFSPKSGRLNFNTPNWNFKVLIVLKLNGRKIHFNIVLIYYCVIINTSPEQLLVLSNIESMD